MTEEEVVMNPPKEEVPEPEAPVYVKEESKPKATRKRAKKVKVEDFKFKPEDYKEIESYEEKIPVRQLNARGQLVTEMTPTGRFLDREVLSEAFVKKWGRGSRKSKSAMHQAKCCFRAGEQFGVNLDHLAKGYSLLNGKKIDGIWSTDLIDRFGWSDGNQMSRADMAKRYGKLSMQAVDIAQKKLYDILNTSDIAKAYVDLVKDIKEEFARDLRDKTVYGE